MNYGLKTRSHSEAEEKYKALREIAFEIAMENSQISKYLGLRI